MALRSRRHERPHGFKPRHAPSAQTEAAPAHSAPREDAPSLVTSLTDSYSTFMERVLSGWADVLNIGERALATAGTPPGDEFSTLVPEITAPTERLRFNVLYRGPQKFACTEIPLAEVKAIRHACGTSINDVLLALVTATIRRYCEFHGDSVKGRQFRVMIPVNLRGGNSSGELGNCISLIAVTVPLDIKPPRKLLAEVHKRTEFLKHAHAAELVGLVGGLLGVLPFSIQAFVGPMISQVPITPFNMVCTNVPGPQFPLYVLGHKMVHWYPYVPVGGEMALNCAILSYNGMIYFGFSGDANITPDIERLEKLLQSNFDELRAAAGVKPLRANVNTKRAPAKRKVSRAVPKPTSTLRIPISAAGNSLSAASVPPPELTFEKKKINKQVVEEKMFQADELTVQATA